MAARYIIFDGHLPFVFPQGISTNLMSLAVEDHGLGRKATSSGECFYTSEKGWTCRKYVVDCGWISAKADAEILNRHLCN